MLVTLNIIEISVTLTLICWVTNDSLKYNLDDCFVVICIKRSIVVTDLYFHNLYIISTIKEIVTNLIILSASIEIPAFVFLEKKHSQSPFSFIFIWNLPQSNFAILHLHGLAIYRNVANFDFFQDKSTSSYWSPTNLVLFLQELQIMNYDFHKS